MTGEFVEVTLLYKLKPSVCNLRMYPSTCYSPLGSDIFISTVFLKYSVDYVLIQYGETASLLYYKATNKISLSLF